MRGVDPTMCDGRLVAVDGRKVLELVDPNDGARRVFQYRRGTPIGIEKRILGEGGRPLINPDTMRPALEWEVIPADDLVAMWRAQSPILMPLGIGFKEIREAILYEDVAFLLARAAEEEKELEP